MADIKRALDLLAELEYTKMPSKFLHLNSGETGFTCGGVYRSANPTAIDWNMIENIVLICKGNIKRASVMLHADRTLQKEIATFSKKEIWDKMNLDLVKSQKIANEMFLFGFHTHWKTAAKVAQRIIGANDDGFIGTKESIPLLNSFDIDTFDMVYDEEELKHYEELIKRRPYLQSNYNGWRNRAYKA